MDNSGNTLFVVLLLLIGGGAAVYFLTRQKTPAPPPQACNVGVGYQGVGVNVSCSAIGAGVKELTHAASDVYNYATEDLPGQSWFKSNASKIAAVTFFPYTVTVGAVGGAKKLIDSIF